MQQLEFYLRNRYKWKKWYKFVLGSESEGPSETECRPYIEKALQREGVTQGELVVVAN